VPLGLALDRFGDAAVAGPNQFDVEGITVGGAPLTSVASLGGPQLVQQHFARAEFVEVPEEDRLTKPAYDELDAGVEFSSAGYDVSVHAVRTPMTYETRYLDLETGEIRPDSRPETADQGLGRDVLQAFGRYGAAGRASQRVVEDTASVRRPLSVGEPQVVAADRSSLDLVDVGAPTTTADIVVEQRIRRSGVAAQIVEWFELADE
jgi:hypothetical protein